jgi:hypothetical protein
MSFTVRAVTILRGDRDGKNGDRARGDFAMKHADSVR